MVLRTAFIANIALVLDASLGGDGENAAARGEVVADTWRIPEEARHQSPVAAKLLELPVQVLKKRGNHPALNAPKKRISGRFGQKAGSSPLTPDSQPQRHAATAGKRIRDSLP